MYNNVTTITVSYKIRRYRVQTHSHKNSGFPLCRSQSHSLYAIW